MRSHFGKINYSHRHQDRRKLTNYLRTGSFRSAGSAVYHSQHAVQARMILVVVAFVVCAIGFYHVIF